MEQHPLVYWNGSDPLVGFRVISLIDAAFVCNQMNADYVMLTETITERDKLLLNQSRGWSFGICPQHGYLAMRRSRKGHYYCPQCRRPVPQDVLWTPDKIAELRERAETAEEELRKIKEKEHGFGNGSL